MESSTIVVVQGASSINDIPRLGKVPRDVELRFADDPKTLRSVLPGADVILGWNFSSSGLADSWDQAKDVKWIQWSGAGVDAIMFPDLVKSNVTLTNCRGVFDRAMAEYVLGLLIAMAKRFPETYRNQLNSHWDYRLTELMFGKRALIVGTGSIGREIGRLLRAFGLEVNGVGRTRRDVDPDFSQIYAQSELTTGLSSADYVIVVVPSTPTSRGMINTEAFDAMKPSARFVNVARGDVIDEHALIVAIREKKIAAAALDVFTTEPLPETNPFWQMENVLVSPHMSGDYYEHNETMIDIFLDNLERYRGGKPLKNIIDKTLGFAAAE